MGNRVVDKLLNIARERKEKERAQTATRSFALPRVEGDRSELAILTAPVAVDNDDESFPPFDSELYERLLLEEKYFTFSDDWKDGKSPDTIYHTLVKQSVFIKERIGNLLTAIVRFGSLADVNDLELRFLLEKFYYVSDYALEKDEALLRVEDPVERINRVCDDIVDLACAMRKYTSDEVYWEVKKYFDFSRRLTFNDLCYFGDDVKTVKTILQKSESWELDILLAQVMERNITHELGRRSAREYFDKFGREYDEERMTKEVIRLLIKCGARLNVALLSLGGDSDVLGVEREVAAHGESVSDALYIKRLSFLTYEQFVYCRDEERTHELLLELSDIKLAEIRRKYFCCEPLAAAGE